MRRKPKNPDAWMQNRAEAETRVRIAREGGKARDDRGLASTGLDRPAEKIARTPPGGGLRSISEEDARRIASRGD